MAFAKRTPEEVLSLVQAEGIEIVDFRFSDLPGLMQHYSLPAHELTLDSFEEGSGFDGSSIRGLPGDPGVRHAPGAGPEHGRDRPVPPAQDPQPQLLRPGPGHRRVVLPRPPLRGQEGRGLPGVDRRRRHRLLRPGGRVLHLQRHPLRPELARGLLPHRLGRGHLELRARTRGRTSASSPGTRRATSRFRPWTISRISARR